MHRQIKVLDSSAGTRACALISLFSNLPCTANGKFSMVYEFGGAAGMAEVCAFVSCNLCN